MSDNNTLLFELGGEELPPKSLAKLSAALLENIQQGLRKAELDFGTCQAFATPRRLAVMIENLSAAQADKSVEKRGPALQAAFNADGTPTKATEGFARSCGTTVEQLGTVKTDKGEWLSFTQWHKGQASTELLPDIIRHSINELPIAKRMRWGNSSAEFVRPVHWAVLLYGAEVIETDILGIGTGRQTRGHRFHAPQTITLNYPHEYSDKLREQGQVIASFADRQMLIYEAANQAAASVGGTAHIEEELLEEVAALNEWPVPVVGHFAEHFLALPAEVLITTMQSNQKYFPVKDGNGCLLPHFITFSNIASTRPESIQHGNERVIVPRLNDAEFFWKQDRKKPLQDRVPALAHIIFQKDLGTLADKSARVEKLAEFIAKRLHGDGALVRRAAQLAKADLLTEMVGEFPNLQGIMGRYYAAADGEPAEVAQAIEEHYFPKQSGGATPDSKTGQILALAEKIDTLCGIFSAGLIPSGDKDPYALRRAALGALRIIVERALDLSLPELVEHALQHFTHRFDKDATRRLVLEFIHERYKGYCLERGYSADEFEAVSCVQPPKPLDFEQRLKAVKSFRQRPEAESLAAANKRIRNILRKSETPPAASVGTLAEAQEQQLLTAAMQAAEDILPSLENRDYQAALNRLAQLRPEVDAFFDHVMVMVEDLELRANRLALLSMLADLFLQIADISKLQS
ncbi:MAG: glycine--tRNA ligase subunit beta [Gammaproteobacteria bacterium]